MLSEREYRAANAVSRSSLNVAHASWNLYFLRYVAKTVPEENEPTAAILKGNLSHAALFDPAKLNDFIVIPPAALSRNGHRRGIAWQQFATACHAAGKTPIPREIAEAATLMCFRVQQAIGPLLLNASERWCERPILWRHRSGVDCKALLDFLYRDGAGRLCILDLKSTETLDDSAFGRKSRKWGYWLQDVHYREAVEMEFPGEAAYDFLFVCVESQPPYRVRLKRFTPQMISRAEQRRAFLLDEIARRTESGDWGEHDEDDINEIEHGL